VPGALSRRIEILTAQFELHSIPSGVVVDTGNAWIVRLFSILLNVYSYITSRGRSKSAGPDDPFHFEDKQSPARGVKNSGAMPTAAVLAA
jgi:hypothetical protein